ncbi:MaoC family dehydratase [Arthrobacter sp. efr-133-TYG-118]|uniref:MaoC family dehydratase n=1 Tax=Arthrobacter sp. efr-133-TYG-118 TaxID=3040279 RepID=UPI00254B8434|nr:MaoC family dehydratase [Arthrobacter sp. efr-133-TYG-118]
MSRRAIATLEELESLVGRDVGTSDWLVVDQARIDAFAKATDDHQWIHVDHERATAGAFGTTIAHGFLTISLIPHFAGQIYGIEFGSARLNYGVEGLRFPNPVPVGSRIRATASFTDLKEKPRGNQLTTKYVVEIEGQDRPACVGSVLTLIVD